MGITVQLLRVKKYFHIDFITFFRFIMAWWGQGQETKLYIK